VWFLNEGTFPILPPREDGYGAPVNKRFRRLSLAHSSLKLFQRAARSNSFPNVGAAAISLSFPVFMKNAFASDRGAARRFK